MLKQIRPTILALWLASVSAGAVNLPVRSDDANSSCAELCGTDTPTGNPTRCPTGTQYFKQLVDHDNSTQETFLQQYQIIDQFFKPGGPIYYYQGGESATFPCSEYAAIHQYANETGGLAIALQHRYFGISVPFGLNYSNNDEWTTNDLRAMTLRDAQMDAVRFVEWVKKTVPGASGSKAIALGGSYPGILVSLLRLHHPNTFFGAIGSSAPLRLDSSSNGKYTTVWGDTTSRVIRDFSAPLSNKVKAAFRSLHRRIAAKDFTGIAKDMALCYPPNSTADAPKLLQLVLKAFTIPTQQNNALTGYAFQSLMSAVAAANSSAEVISVSQALYRASNGNASCTDWNLSFVEAQKAAAGTPFAYLRCRELPYPDGYASAGSIFGEILPDTKYPSTLSPMCQSIFGIEAILGGPAYERSIGVDDVSLAKSERLILSQGTWDQVYGFSSLGWQTPDSVDKSRVLFITGAGHGTDIAMAAPKDTDAVKLARQTELQSIKEWIGLA